MLMIFGFILLALVVFGFASIVVVSLRVGISPMPSSREARVAMIELLPKNLSGQIHELGSGWGGLALALARAFPRCTIVATEASLVPFLFSRALVTVSGARNVRIAHGDFMSAPLGKASAVVCYLFTGGMTRLAPKVEQECAVGTLVVSKAFAMPGWTPMKKRTLDDLWHTPIFLYRR